MVVELDGIGEQTAFGKDRSVDSIPACVFGFCGDRSTKQRRQTMAPSARPSKALVKEEKKGDDTTEAPAYSAENIQQNMKIIYYSRTFLSIVGGVVAGVLGLPAISGFLFYFFIMLLDLCRLYCSGHLPTTLFTFSNDHVLPQAEVKQSMETFGVIPKPGRKGGTSIEVLKSRTCRNLPSTVTRVLGEDLRAYPASAVLTGLHFSLPTGFVQLSLLTVGGASTFRQT
ncbi:hypothetical protein R1flu_028175 [Riccia fluitans]|uniref:ER membrane protein complex subunit 6 n=1 Tax=Riccia fluitans TaxID=41844 RepID=A0ABD1XKY0_9MARC